MSSAWITTKLFYCTFVWNQYLVRIRMHSLKASMVTYCWSVSSLGKFKLKIKADVPDFQFTVVIEEYSDGAINKDG